MDQHVEHEDDPDWQEKRIGGIKVGQSEVRQAKQCKWQWTIPLSLQSFGNAFENAS